MTGFGAIFTTLHTMSQQQLLLAFIACTSYSLAQGALLQGRARRSAWVITAVAVVGFCAVSSEPAIGAILCAFAVTGLAFFVAGAWLLSGLLGFSARPADAGEAAVIAEAQPTPAIVPTPALQASKLAQQGSALRSV